MELSELERDTGVVTNLYDDVGLRATPRPRGHGYRSGGPHHLSEKQLINQMGLKVGDEVRMPTGELREIVSIRDDRVYVFGIRKFINLYAVTRP